eukprot:1280344-Pleurochrysis_carterae.AAC.1
MHVDSCASACVSLRQRKCVRDRRRQRGVCAAVPRRRRACACALTTSPSTTTAAAVSARPPVRFHAHAHQPLRAKTAPPFRAKSRRLFAHIPLRSFAPKPRRPCAPNRATLSRRNRAALSRQTAPPFRATSRRSFAPKAPRPRVSQVVFAARDAETQEVQTGLRNVIRAFQDTRTFMYGRAEATKLSLFKFRRDEDFGDWKASEC